MKKGTKKLVKVFNKIFAFVSPIVIIFLAMMMIGKALPSWASTTVMVVGWALLVSGVLHIIFAFMDLFK